MNTAISHLALPAGPLEWSILVVATIATVVLLYSFAGWPVAITMAIVGVLGCVAMEQVAITVGISIVALLVRIRKPSVDHVKSLEFVIQTAFVLTGLAVYQFLREQVVAPRDVAVDNAQHVLNFERSLPILRESTLQDVLVPNVAMMHVFNAIYFLGFLGFIAAVLCWLYFEHPDNFRIFRNALAISAILATFTIALFPVAPPRMMAEAGVIDTFVFLGKPMEFANEFAAVPSLHVGWTALAGVMMGRIIGGNRGFALGLVPGIVMTLTVVATGNHYWLDAAIGATYAIGPVVLMDRLRANAAAPVPALVPAAERRRDR